jgi:hypothetical protein
LARVAVPKWLLENMLSSAVGAYWSVTS